MTPTTLEELLEQTWRRHPRADLYGYKRAGRWHNLSAAEARARKGRLASALAGLGLVPGDRVAIMAPTRLEWALVDYACQSSGLVVVPLYPTLPSAQIATILAHAGARAAFIADAEHWGKLEEVRTELPALEKVVSFDPIEGDGAPDSFAAFLDSGDAEGPSGVARPDDLASIIYTSGTTGDPKGVLLTQANIVSNVLACTEVLPFCAADVQLSFLPLSHIFERMVHYYMLWNGVSVYFEDDHAQLLADLKSVRPTVLTSVPRVLEKVLGKVEEGASAGGLKGKLARAGIDTARAWARCQYGHDGSRAGLGLGLRRALLDRLVYRKIRGLLGGRVHVIVTGGAATPGNVTEFFNGAGVRVLPGYGLTESSPVIAFNTVTTFRFGSVGKPIPGTEVKIAADGEILARGPGVMQGYYQNDEQTALALDGEGFLRTGDIGRLDGDGYLSITDRKKDLLVTSQGKNVAPQPIEQRLVQDGWIAQAMLVGDDRPYVTALLVPQLQPLLDWARGRGLPCEPVSELVCHPDVVALFEERVQRCCEGFARHEQVKKVALLERELSEAEGELTPTLKIKRRVVAERFARVIDGLYP